VDMEQSRVFSFNSEKVLRSPLLDGNTQSGKVDQGYRISIYIGHRPSDVSGRLGSHKEVGALATCRHLEHPIYQDFS
jgi:hypothetical protein